MTVDTRQLSDVSQDLERTENYSVDLEPNYRLTPGWQTTISKLNSTEIGQEVVTDPNFREFYWMNSDEMAVIQESVQDGTFNSENITPRLTRGIYYSHPSFVSMHDRPEVLELVAAGTVRDMQDLIDSGERTTSLLRCRRLASIFEELGSITKGAQSEEYEYSAIMLNQKIVDSELYLPQSPRKLHAIFAPYDILFRRKAELFNLPDFNETQAAYYDDLAGVLDMVRHSNLRKEAVSGAFGELLILGRLRDLIADSGMLGEVDASQSFIRQDHTNNVRLRGSIKWKWAFDIALKNRETGNLVPVEVKKRTQGSRLTSEIASYLPIINIVLLRLGQSKMDFLTIAEQYSQGRHNELIGNKPTRDQQKATELFTGKVDSKLMELIESTTLENSIPTAI